MSDAEHQIVSAVAVYGGMSLPLSRPLVAKAVAAIHMSPKMRAPSVRAARAAMGCGVTRVVSVFGLGGSGLADSGSCLSSASVVALVTLAFVRVFVDVVLPLDFMETVLLPVLPGATGLGLLPARSRFEA